MRKILLTIFIGLCIGCSNSKLPEITLKVNKESVAFSGIDAAIVSELGRDSLPLQTWQSLLPVYKMPADTDLKDFQLPQPGKYLVKDGTVLFTPDTPFLTQQTYFARYYNFNKTNNLWDLMRLRQKPGAAGFKELTFKP